MEATLGDTLSIRTFYKTIRFMRKIGNEMLISCSSEGMSFRTLNIARSALPIVKFMPSYFISYSNESEENETSVQVSCDILIDALKKMNIPSMLLITVLTDKITFEVANKYNIRHCIQIFVNSTSCIMSSHDIDSYQTIIKASSSLFCGIEKSFKANTNMFLTINTDPKNHVVIETSLDSSTSKYAKLSIKTNQQFEIKTCNAEPVTVVFSSSDFFAAMKLAQIISEDCQILTGQPGLPIMIKSENDKSNIIFEAVLATGGGENEEDDELENSNSQPLSNDESLPTTQAQPWKRQSEAYNIPDHGEGEINQFSNGNH